MKTIRTTDASGHPRQGDLRPTVRFSVLIPVYNREQFVMEAIDSVLSQTFTNFELFAIDDGCTDRTPDVLASYGARIKVIHQANQGPEVARNTGAALAQGEYLVFLDSDDLLLPHALETYDRVLQAFDSPPLLIGSMSYFQDGESAPPETPIAGPIEILKYPDYLSKDVTVGLSNSRIVIRKSVFDAVGGARTSTATTWHADDFQLILKVGTYGPCLVLQRPHTVLYRTHDDNSIRHSKATVDGILSLVRSERQGQYPGGSRRRLARFACIGGIAWLWIKYCHRRGSTKLALQLFLASAPMVLAAVGKKLLMRVRKPIQPVVLSQS